LEHVESTFQEEMAKLELNLQQAISERDKAQRKADEDAEREAEDVERLQKQVKAFKLMKFQEGYNDGRKRKASRYPLEVRSSDIERNPEVA